MYLPLQVLAVNVNGVLYTAQAAGQQMKRFGNGGSIILVGSMSGSITNQVLQAIQENQGSSLTFNYSNKPGYHTTRLRRRYCRWREIWRVNLHQNALG